MNGFELYREIEEIDNNAKVCFITGFELYYKSLGELFPTVKVDCFIKKPITTNELVQRILKVQRKFNKLCIRRLRR